MKIKIASPAFNINGFSATHIIFDDSQYATIWATCRINHKLQDVSLVFDYNQLNEMLRFSGEKGERILLSMVDEMMSNTTPPYMILFKNILSNHPVFTNVRLTVSAFQSSTTLEATPNCWIVEDVWPINIIQQAKNLNQHVVDFSSISIVSEEVMHTSLLQLQKMFAYYSGLMELDLSEQAAREKAQLADDRLFAMAKSASNMDI